MRTGVASVLLSYATASPDETSLMQDMVQRSSSRKLQVESTRQDAASKLLDTAVAMLENGVTPDVVSFVEATQQANQEVFQYIINDHILERNYVQDVCMQFEDALAELKESELKIKSKAGSQETARAAHHECRLAESDLCGKYRTCESQLIKDWETVVFEESVMRQRHDDIEGTWCVDEDGTHGEYQSYDAVNGWKDYNDWLNGVFDDHFWAGTNKDDAYPALTIPGTVVTFRATSVTHFEAYRKQKDVVQKAWKKYKDKVIECADAESLWEEKIPVCDSAQTTAHGHACDHAAEVQRARTTIGTTWETVTNARLHQMDNRLELEEARKKEWETLSIVQCLLEHVHTAVVYSIETGAPCPTLTSDETKVKAQIEQCHQVERGCDQDLGRDLKTDPELAQLALDGVRSSTHLCITPCEEPEPPPLPIIEAPPCTPAYIAQELALESGDAWPECAPPLACIDCNGEDFRPLEPVKVEDGKESEFVVRKCRLHEMYLSEGQSNVNSFRCSSGLCIDQEARCNGRNECGDEDSSDEHSSDEQGCDDAHSEHQPLSHVTSVQAGAVWGRYTSSSFTCPDDFYNDVHHRCGNSECIEKVGLCNGIPNCEDGSDEDACDELDVEVASTSGRSATVVSNVGSSTDEEVFGDRGYIFDSLGDMAGKTFIRYSNEDKMIEDDHVMTTLRTNMPARVYIATTASHTLHWLTSQHWSLSSRQGPSFGGVKMTRHKEWKIEHEQGLHTDLWKDQSHGRLATAHWGGEANEHWKATEHWNGDETTDEVRSVFKTENIYYKDFPAGVISISGNAPAVNIAANHYDGPLSSTEKGTDGSFLIFLEKFESFGEETTGLQFQLSDVASADCPPGSSKIGVDLCRQYAENSNKMFVSITNEVSQSKFPTGCIENQFSVGFNPETGATNPTAWLVCASDSSQ